MMIQEMKSNGFWTPRSPERPFSQNFRTVSRKLLRNSGEAYKYLEPIKKIYEQRNIEVKQITFIHLSLLTSVLELAH